MRGEVQDRYGNTFSLTNERWEHIIENHPELEGLHDKVLNAVRSGARTRDLLSLDTFYCNKNFLNLLEDFDEIEVVVVFRWLVKCSEQFLRYGISGLSPEAKMRLSYDPEVDVLESSLMSVCIAFLRRLLVCARGLYCISLRIAGNRCN